MVIQKIMLMLKNSVKLRQWTDSQLDVFSNLWHNLSMTRSKLNPLESLEWRRAILGLVLGVKEAVGFTQAVKLNWNSKIGIDLQKNLVTVSFCITAQANGLIICVESRDISFASLSNWCWIIQIYVQFLVRCAILWLNVLYRGSPLVRSPLVIQIFKRPY